MVVSMDSLSDLAGRVAGVGGFGRGSTAVTVACVCRRRGFQAEPCNQLSKSAGLMGMLM